MRRDDDAGGHANGAFERLAAPSGRELDVVRGLLHGSRRRQQPNACFGEREPTVATAKELDTE